MQELGVMNQINSTNGMIGKLINDPTLYNESSDLIGETRATVTI